MYTNSRVPLWRSSILRRKGCRRDCISPLRVLRAGKLDGSPGLLRWRCCHGGGFPLQYVRACFMTHSFLTLGFISYDDVYITNDVYIFIRKILWSCTVVFLRMRVSFTMYLVRDDLINKWNQYCKILQEWLQELTQNINQMLVPKRHPIHRPNGRAMGCFFMNISEKVDRVITTLHCVCNRIHTLVETDVITLWCALWTYHQTVSYSNVLDHFSEKNMCNHFTSMIFPAGTHQKGNRYWENLTLVCCVVYDMEYLIIKYHAKFVCGLDLIFLI